jgi:hypothetical protein
MLPFALMTQGALTLDKPATPGPIRARSVLEFLITGGATLLLIPLAYWYRKHAGLDHSVYVVSFLAFYAAYLINDPHFAASYMLFYKNVRARLSGEEFQGAQRIRFLISGFVVPAVLVGWIVFALTTQSAAIMGGMVQLMFFLVGWHYVKQGFGVLTVLSGRNGVRFSPRERFIALAHCFSAWAYAWTSPRETSGQYNEWGIVYTALSHPAWIEPITRVAFIASSLALAWAVIERVRKHQPLPPLAASCGFFMALWLWTVYSNFDPLIAYVIPGLHSLQYWYFVYLLKRNEARSDARSGNLEGSWVDRLSTMFGPIWGRLGLFFVTAVFLAYLGFNGIPDFIDRNLVATVAMNGPDPDVSTVGLGATPYLAAFSTFINIHHYFMDHVIWRRENPDTMFLKD